MGSQLHEHGGHLVAQVSVATVGANGDGRHRNQRGFREFALRFQVTPQRPPDDGQHDIVDFGALDSGFDRFDPRKVQGDTFHDPVGGYLCIEACARSAQCLAQGKFLGQQTLDGARKAWQTFPGNFNPAERLLDVSHIPANCHFHG